MTFCIHQQAAIELHNQRIHPPQAFEVGVAHAEIIDGDLKAEGFSQFDKGQQRLAVAGGAHQRFVTHQFLVGGAEDGLIH